MRVKAPDLEARISAVLVAGGASLPQAAATARHMVWCEMVGRHNFGIERIAIHLKRMAAGVLDGKAIVLDDQLAPSIARCEGGGGFGYHAGEHAMTLAIAMAKRHGVGIAGVCNSNFFGAGAYYVNMAANACMIGLAMSNSFPKVVAHGGIKPVLGTNPFAFGAPRRNGDHLLFDMATSGLAGSTVREHIATNQPLPAGLAIDAEGHPITDARKVSEGALLPFGGAKGYGLSLLVEILAGVLTGAGVGDGVASMYSDFARSGGNGHFFMALDVTRWMDIETYHTRFDGLVAALKASGDGVLLPGEIRWEQYRDALANGVEVDDAQWATLQKILLHSHKRFEPGN